MKKFYPHLCAAGLAALIFGYVELRLPTTVGAQGRDGVYERLAVTGPLRVGGEARFEGALPKSTGSGRRMQRKSDFLTEDNFDCHVEHLRGTVMSASVTGQTLAIPC